MRKIILIVISLIFTTGCIATISSRRVPDFEDRIGPVKTIAVLPADIEVYKITAGGVTELIDEWSDEAKDYTSEVLLERLGQKYGFEIKFISEPWLKEKYKELWNENRALYGAVSSSIGTHAYPGPHSFPDKVENFNYTLGSQFKALAEACEADTVLFVRGIDHEATAGRNVLQFWNILAGAVTGVTVLLYNPCAMDIALVDNQTGDVLWYKATMSETDYSFRNKDHIDAIFRWLLKDFLKEE